MLPKTELAERVGAARMVGRPWYEYAAILAEVLKDEPIEHEARLWRIVQKESGISDLMLRRYFAAEEKLTNIESTHGLDAGALHSAAFAPVELALRLYGRDPAAGVETLLALRSRTKSLRDIRADLARSAGASTDVVARQRRNRDRGILVARCEELVEMDAARLFGAGIQSMRRPSARYLRRVGFEFRDHDHHLVAGADLYLSETGGRDPLDDIAQTVLLADYLPSFYLVVAPDLDRRDAEKAVWALDAMDARDVGVILLRDQGGADIVRSASNGQRSFDPFHYQQLLRTLAAGRAPLL